MERKLKEGEKQKSSVAVDWTTLTRVTDADARTKLEAERTAADQKAAEERKKQEEVKERFLRYFDRKRKRKRKNVKRK